MRVQQEVPIEPSVHILILLIKIKNIIDWSPVTPNGVGSKRDSQFRIKVTRSIYNEWTRQEVPIGSNIHIIVQQN